MIDNKDVGKQVSKLANASIDKLRNELLELKNFIGKLENKYLNTPNDMTLGAELRKELDEFFKAKIRENE